MRRLIDLLFILVRANTILINMILKVSLNTLIPGKEKFKTHGMIFPFFKLLLNFWLGSISKLSHKPKNWDLVCPFHWECVAVITFLEKIKGMLNIIRFVIPIHFRWFSGAALNYYFKPTANCFTQTVMSFYHIYWTLMSESYLTAILQQYVTYAVCQLWI